MVDDKADDKVLQLLPITRVNKSILHPDLHRCHVKA